MIEFWPLAFFKKVIVISGILISLNICIFIFSVLLIALSWPHRKLPAIHYLIILTLAFCLASFFTLNVYISTSFEAKTVFSRLRFISFSLMCPAALLFFAGILGKWKWLYKTWIKFILFFPSFITILFAVGILPKELLLYNYEAFSHSGVSVLTYKTGPAFLLHYRWTNILTLSILGLLYHTIFTDKKKRKYAAILSLGVIVGAVVDAYGVVTNSPTRWLMIGAGTFVITEIAIFYVAFKTGLFGLISTKKSQQKLEEKIDFQKQLISLLSHDLSGNVHQQAMLSHFLLGKNLDKESSELINMLANSSQSSKELLTNLMTWVKTQDGQKFIINLEHFNAHEIIEKCIAIVKTSTPHKKMRIIQDDKNNNFFIHADIEMFSSITRNLISNALNASGEEAHIIIKVYENEDKMMCEIKDHGKGLEAHELLALKQNQKLRSSGHGHGLGLALVRHLIDIHHGTFDIKSTPQVGTTITFSIPK